MKKQVEKLRAEADRAAGKVEQLMAQLKDQFGCDTIEDAQKKLKKLERDKIKAKKIFDTKLKLFESEWGERLEELGG